MPSPVDHQQVRPHAAPHPNLLPARGRMATPVSCVAFRPVRPRAIILQIPTSPMPRHPRLAHARRCYEARRAQLRRQHRPRRLQRARRQGQLDWHRRRLLPCRRRRRPQRPGEGEIPAAQRQGTLHGAAVGRDRSPVAQHHVDHEPRHLARSRIRRRHVLRRLRIHDAQVAGPEVGQGSRPRQHLHADRHDERTRPRRLLRHQRHHLQAGRLRTPRRSARRLQLRPLRRADDRQLAAHLRARCACKTRTSTRSCPS